MDIKKKSWIDFYEKYKFALIGLIAVTLATYLFQITNFTLSIDEQGFYNNQVYIGFSRYGTIPIKQLFGDIPIFGSYLDILCIIFLYIFAVLMAFEYYKISNLKINAFNIFIFMSIIISFPYNANYIIFGTYSFEVSVGLCIAALAIKFTNDFLQEKKYKFVVYAVLLLTFAVSIYQSFFSIYIVGACFSLFFIFVQGTDTNNTKPFFIAFLKYISILVTSYILYYIGDIIIRRLANHPASSGYVNRFFEWGKQPFIQTAKELIEELLVIAQGKTYPDFRLLVMPITGILVIALLFFYLIVSKKNMLITAICVFGFALSPFMLSIGIGNVMPTRALLGVSLAMAGIWLLAGEVVSKNKAIRNIFFAIAVYFVMFSARATSSLLFSDYMVLVQERDLMVKISDRIELLGYGESPQVPVIFQGYRHVTKTRNMYDAENLGRDSSMFQHFTDIGTQFMAYYGYQYVAPSVEQVADAYKASCGMPFWPDEGSVAYKNGVIVVNFNNATQFVTAPTLWSESTSILTSKHKYNGKFEILHFAENSDKVLMYGYATPYDNGQPIMPYIALKSEENVSLFTTNQISLNFNPADRLGNSCQPIGFMAQIDKNVLETGTYQVELYIEENSEVYSISLNKEIRKD